MRVRMMDMGNRRYGDCSLVSVGGRTILIDGGHRGDERGTDEGGTDLLGRMRAALGVEGQVRFDLLVVTHAHSDHVGCLPELVSGGDLAADWVLAVDEGLSFGRDAPVPPVATTPERIAAAMREELLPGTASAEEVRVAIDDAATLEDRYGAMLGKLADNGATVVRLGRDACLQLEREFAGIGLKVLGPSQDQLVLCADAVNNAREAALQRASSVSAQDAGVDEVSLYRSLTTNAMDDASAADGSGSAAVNCQSVILRLGLDPGPAVFMGDMQFAAPQVARLNPHVQALLQTVRAAGPYAFARLPHHGAANGTDRVLLNAVGATAALGISGGLAGEHPAGRVLQLLTSSPGVEWARTDSNGAVVWDDRQSKRWDLSRGVLNDGSLPVGAADEANAVPVRRRRAARPASPSGESDGALAAGRKLPRLLFVTDLRALERCIGEDAATAGKIVRDAGHQLLDVRDEGAILRIARRAAVGYDGVVLLGGHGVVPVQVVDALPPEVRSSLSRRNGDPDRHFVWSDDPYVSLQDDSPDIPVSRIPDGGRGDLVLGALRNGASPGAGGFGLRNADRPFADEVYSLIADGVAMDVAEPARSGAYVNRVTGPAYIMLHGGHEDGGRYWGSDEGEDAFLLSDVPERFRGVVFSGCCYGALTVDGRACDATGSERSTGPDQSIAMRFLGAGANAFVGATAVHYSPISPPYDDASGPMHAAFWRRTAEGIPPARALFNAKLEYLANILSLRDDTEPGEKAIAFKTWRQFTCLGLGW